MRSERVTTYVAGDGTRFFSEEEARIYEIRSPLVELMKELCPGGFPEKFLESVLANRQRFLAVLGCECLKKSDGRGGPDDR